MRKLLVLFAILICAAPAMAVTNIYVSATAQGANNGTNCSNSYAYNDVTHGVTVAGNQIAGNNYHLCGTFTGTAGALLINPTTGSGGTSGNPFIITFEAGAVLTSPQWGQFGAIGIFQANWVTIDGGTNGTIQNTANGTGLANAANSAGVWIGQSNNIVVKNLTIANICQHTSATDSTGCQTSGTFDAGIKVVNNGSTGSPVTLTGNTIHDTYTGISVSANSGDGGFTIKNNSISRTNWDINLGAGAGNSGPWDVEDNDLTCVVAAPCNWNENSNVFHHNGIIADPGASTNLTGLVIANNYFHDINPCTAFTFLTPAVPGMGGDTPGVLIYNNVGFTTAGQVGPANGYFGAGPSITGAIVVNNTVVGGDTTGGDNPIGIVGYTNTTLKNNIVSTTQFPISFASGFSGIASDYNDFYNFSQGLQCGSTLYASLAAWQAGCGFDAHSIAVNPLLSGFLIGSLSPARGTGTNLTSLGIAGLDVGAPQTFGVGGTCGTGCLARSATLPWDMGAYPFSGAAPPTTTVPTSILPTSLASGQVGVPYPAVNFSTVGGVAPDSYSISNAPPGVNFLSTGIPTIAGTYIPKVTATDSNGKSVAQIYSVTIAPAAVVTPSILPATYKCSTTYTVSIDVSGAATSSAPTFSCVRQ